MNTLSILLILFFTVIGITIIKAQDEEELIELGHEMYNFGDKKGALEMYLQALKINSNNPLSNLMAGICYFEIDEKVKSISIFEKIYPVPQEIIIRELLYWVEFPDELYDLWEETDFLLYLTGQAYQFDYQFEKAIDYHKRYKKDIIDRDLKPKKGYKENSKEILLKKIDKSIYECNNGKEFVQFPIGVIIQNVGHDINTPYPEYVPLISTDEDIMIFTSRRNNTTGGNKDIDNQFYEDIYISHKEGHRWTPAKNIGLTINSYLHDACIALSSDGKQLFVYNNAKGGDIYLSLLEDNIWSVPKTLGKTINSKFLEASASITSDGNTLYFSSARPDNKDLDIYMSVKDEFGNWNEPTNLGSIINTGYDEDAPFILSDNKTLTFSSKGHKGMGGFDIFRTTLNADSTWSEPINLGYPINTTGDDVYMVFSEDGSTGYFSSVRKGGFGEKDIYKITFPKMLSSAKSGEEGELLSYVTNFEIGKKKPLEIKVSEEVLVSNCISSLYYFVTVHSQQSAVHSQQ